MTNERAALIEKYQSSYQAVVDALGKATTAELEHRPAPGKWSAKEIVHHLADSEMMAAMRLRLVLAEEKPIIVAYDQDRFAAKFNYQSRPIESALAAFRYCHETTVEILKQLKEEDWARQAWHTESGVYTAEKWLKLYSQHALNHADQIKKAIASGKK